MGISSFGLPLGSLLILILLAGFGCVSSPPPRSQLHDIDHYTATGWTLMRDGRIDEAVALLAEGIQHNPTAFQLRVVLGQVHTRRGRTTEDPAVANRAFRLASETFQQAVDLGLEERRQTLTTTWSEYQDTDLRAAARMSVLLESKIGSPLQARGIARRYLEEVGPDPVIERNLPATD